MFDLVQQRVVGVVALDVERLALESLGQGLGVLELGFQLPLLALGLVDAGGGALDVGAGPLEGDLQSLAHLGKGGALGVDRGDPGVVLVDLPERAQALDQGRLPVRKLF